MAKLTLWRCDKCGKQIEQPNKPDGWATAEVQVPPPKIYSQADAEFSFLWCVSCWAMISEKISTEVQLR